MTDLALFLGPLRPGLIEATPPAGAKKNADRAFLGPLRPGLIEALRRALFIGLYLPFWGLCAPASLKRSALTFPQVLFRLSGAFAPRPH